MSTTTTTTRKFPPPCWTLDEALVLIDAYRVRLHALHRAFLKTPDWDMVAEKVKSAFPNATPPKTPAQCRHKMEKLRQRHRAEKQRQALFRGTRFVSSWFFFDAMEAMKKNHDEPNNNNNNNNNNNPEVINGIPLLGFNSLPGYQGLNPGSGIQFIPTHDVIINEAYENHKNSLCTSGTPVLIKTGVPSHARKFSKVIHNHDIDDIDESDENSKMWIKVCRNNINPNVKPGKKRVNNDINEVVFSIKSLGEGFMRMEKMKIDMAWENEKMRMETEMKRYQLILESQMQIVDAVVKGLVETRKQRRTDVMTD